MIRHLAPLPAGVSARHVETVTRQRFTKAVAVNDVDDNGTRTAAVYFNDSDGPTAAQVTAWRTDVAAATAQPDEAATILQAGLDGYRDLVTLARDTGQTAIVRRICADVAKALRAIALRDEAAP